MEKSTFTREYRIFCQQLKATRVRAGVTQLDLAKRLRETQSEISKFERGERRLDLVQLRKWCRAIDIGLADFVDSFEAALVRKY